MLEEPGEKDDDPNGTPDAEPAELTAMGVMLRYTLRIFDKSRIFLFSKCKV